FDLIVMGRPEGAGCYCAANSLLTACLEKLIDNYDFVITDNEAGMEHISRLISNNIDVLLVISDPTRRGIQAAARIVELTDELGLNIGRKGVVVNQVKDGQEETIEKLVEEYKLDLIGMVPEDPDVREFDLNGRPTIDLPEDNTGVRRAYDIFKRII
ncbi:MAG: carbon monoxide dehydrogenase, partial [Thermodesulfobacteriota bacterium]|nr:carbon monoxide dehydrogenase [Thermodesulfobacteriota bacterium]